MLPLSPEVKEKAKKVLPFVIVAVVFLLGGAGLGWGLKPDVVQIEEKEKIVTVEKVVDRVVEKLVEVKVKDTQYVERWHTVKTTTKDGAVTETTDKTKEAVVKDTVNTAKDTETVKTVEVEKVVTREIKITPVLAQWRVGVSGGAQFLTAQFPAPVVVLGVEAERRIAGPIWVGVVGSVNAQVSAFDIRAEVAIEF